LPFSSAARNTPEAVIRSLVRHDTAVFDVFVSYRTDDARFGAASAYERLADRFGGDRIFLDHVSLGPGDVYPASIRAAVEQARVMVVLIGHEWFGADHDIEVRLIDRENDWVRREIRRALERGIAIIPVLLDGTPLPSPDSLPPDVRGLVLRQTMEVRHRNLGRDLDRLSDAVARYLPAQASGGAASAPVPGPARPADLDALETDDHRTMGLVTTHKVTGRVVQADWLGTDLPSDGSRRSRSSRARPLILAAGVLAAVSIATIALSADHRASSSIVLGVNAPIGIILALLAIGRERDDEAVRGASTDGDRAARRNAAARRLVDEQLRLWGKEIEQRGIRRDVESSGLAKVRWRYGPAELAPTLDDVNTWPPDTTGIRPMWPDAPRILGTGLVTRLYAEVYSRLRHGRLVILGPAGSGKTAAMLTLMLDALEKVPAVTGPDGRDRPLPVPVWLTLGDWNPTTTSFPDWVVTVISRDHRYLTAREYGADVVTHLLRTGRLALFLDGFDEMPADLRGPALEKLDDEAAGIILVLASRPEAYRSALVSGRFRNAVTIMLLPLSVRAAGKYLTCDRHSYQDEWRAVAQYLRDFPTGIVAETLRTPLTLSLASIAHQDRDPTELIEPNNSRTREDLGRHLLRKYLERAYPNPRQRERAIYSLRWVADRMTSRDLAWWQIPTWISAGRHWIGALTLSLVCGAAVLFTMLGHVFNPVVIILIDVIGGLFVVIGAIQVAALMTMFGSGLMGDSIQRLREGPIFGSPTGPRALRVRLPRPADLRRQLGTGVICGSTAGLTGRLIGDLVGAGWALPFEIGFFVVGGLACAAIDVWLTPVAGEPSATPYTTYKQDRQTSLLCGAVGALVFGTAAGFSIGHVAGTAWGWYGGAFIGAVFALLFGNGDALAILFANVYLLVVEGRLVRIMRLLRDAHDRQVLRQAGAVYQFRHAELQDYLREL
jgi:TIR domain